MTSETVEVARIALRLPPFWKSNVRLWIAQCDHAFTFSGISSDDTKYSALVANLDAETLSYVSDIVLSPPNIPGIQHQPHGRGTSKKLIQAILDKGHTDDPFLAETMKHLETCSEQHQQAVSEFTSHPPCDTPGCTIHSTPHPTPVKENQLEFPQINSVKRKENEDGFASPTLRKLSKNVMSNSNTEINFKVNLTNKFNALANQSETHSVAVKQSPKRTSPTKNTNPDTPKLPPPPC
ncbi:hypothetical protein TNCV_1251981 [Trichonephila clavipes]|nr:hypothetical protein TNCV_1251981 [Trichonephila clavipes]